MRLIEANRDKGDIIECYRRVESLFRQLQVSIRRFHLVWMTDELVE